MAGPVFFAAAVDVAAEFLAAVAFLVGADFLVGVVAVFDVDAEARDFKAAVLDVAEVELVAFFAAVAVFFAAVVVFFDGVVVDAPFFTAAAFAAAVFASDAFAVSLASARAAAAFFAAAVFAAVVAAVRLAAADFDAAVVDAAFFAAAVPAAALLAGVLLAVFLTGVLLTVFLATVLWDVPWEAAVFAAAFFVVLAAAFFAAAGVSGSAAFPERGIDAVISGVERSGHGYYGIKRAQPFWRRPTHAENRRFRGSRDPVHHVCERSRNGNVTDLNGGLSGAISSMFLARRGVLSMNRQ
ncbi:hypothetical protein [Microbacterium suwonense]|uniref:hypothetical protein n=1 Tax=Microbacterium suwonense TaxID=683047 RepID=UPI0025724F3E|nr:hypothetical protein [Microbacterium suwonense]